MGTEKKLVALFRGGFTPAWSVADQAEKDAVTKHWVDIHPLWTKMGCRILATLDDVYTRIGPPGGVKPWSFYEVWEVPDFETVKKMLDMFRPQDGSLRLDKYFFVEAVTGPAILEIERAAAE